MHPSAMVNAMRNRFPELAEVKDIFLHRYADLIMRALSPGQFAHELAGSAHIPENAIAYGSVFLNGFMGRGKFKLLNESMGCIESSRNWSMRRGRSKAYWLTRDGYSLVEDARLLVLKGGDNTLVDKDGIKVRNRRNGVSRTAAGSTVRAVSDAELNRLVPINMNSIHFVLNIGVSSIWPDLTEEKCLRIECQLKALQLEAMSSQFALGCIPQDYAETSSGRLSGQGGLSLQNVHSQVRHIALEGHHEFDFSNCHYQFLYDHANRNNIQIPEISDYINNTADYRSSLAEQLDISVGQAKKILLAVLYGATRSVRAEEGIPSIIGPEKAAAWYQFESCNRLLFEIVEVREHMLDQADRSRDGRIKNCRGKFLKGNSRQEFAHLLQGKESELLHHIIRQYNDQILLVQHDGWTMSEYVDPHEIESFLLEQSDIEMPVTHEQLGLQVA